VQFVVTVQHTDIVAMQVVARACLELMDMWCGADASVAQLPFTVVQPDMLLDAA
jgi:hypothetical protein